MSAPVRASVLLSLQQLERELRRLDVWEPVSPAPDRLASDVPFCHDTLEFTQWVQWVFIPRFRAVLEGDHPLPTACAIAPIAEDTLAALAGDTDELLAAFGEIDRIITEYGASR